MQHPKTLLGVLSMPQTKCIMDTWQLNIDMKIGWLLYAYESGCVRLLSGSFTDLPTR